VPSKDRSRGEAIAVAIGEALSAAAGTLSQLSSNCVIETVNE